METHKDIEGRLKQMGVTLPECVNLRSGVIDRAKQVGDLVFVSGHGPQGPDGKMAFTGRVGGEVSLEEGYEAAKLCVLNCLAAVNAVIGSLDRVEEVIRVRGFVNSAPDFYDQPQVMNGASELLLGLFGERGRHVRTAIGTSVLPGNIPIEVDMILKVEGNRDL